MANAPAQIPTSFGHELTACLRCCLVKTSDQVLLHFPLSHHSYFIYLIINRKQSLFFDSQFRESGCENSPFLQMDEDQERVVECTTPNFNGYVFVKSFYNKTLITFEIY
jgi:transcription elongation factor SPT4